MDFSWKGWGGSRKIHTWLGSVGWKHFSISETSTAKLNLGWMFRAVLQIVPVDTIIYKAKNIPYINRVLYCRVYNNLLTWQIDLMSPMLKIEKLRLRKLKLFAWGNKFLTLYILIRDCSYRQQPSCIYICIVGKSVNHSLVKSVKPQKWPNLAKLSLDLESGKSGL